jgi:large subunit ribosomal protein L9
MQVILLEKVANLGNLGDVVEVQGRLRTQLPRSPTRAWRPPRHRGRDQGVRRRAAPSSEKVGRRQARRRAGAGRAARRQDGAHQRSSAGVDGRLFGSVTNHDIAEAWARWA